MQINFCSLCEFRSVFMSEGACNNIVVNDGKHCDHLKAFMLLLELQGKKSIFDVFSLALSLSNKLEWNLPGWWIISQSGLAAQQGCLRKVSQNFRTTGFSRGIITSGRLQSASTCSRGHQQRVLQHNTAGVACQDAASSETKWLKPVVLGLYFSCGERKANNQLLK